LSDVSGNALTVAAHAVSVTLAIRDYSAAHAEGKLDDDAIESTIVDIIDASFFVSGQNGTFSQPAFVSPHFFGREQEIAALMQESAAGHVDDALELWNVEPGPTTVVPDEAAARRDIGEGVDWSRVLTRSRSHDDVTHRCPHGGPRMGKQRMERRLMKRVESHNALQWPPSPWERMRWTQRPRSSTDVSDVEHPAFLSRSVVDPQAGRSRSGTLSPTSSCAIAED